MNLTEFLWRYYLHLGQQIDQCEIGGVACAYGNMRLPEELDGDAEPKDLVDPHRAYL